MKKSKRPCNKEEVLEALVLPKRLRTNNPEAFSKRCRNNLSICTEASLKRKPLLLIDVSSIGYKLFLQHCGQSPIKEIEEIIMTKLFAYIMNLVEEFKTPKIVLLYDSKTNLRKEKLETYKGQRMTYKTPQEIARIMEMKKCLRRFKKIAKRLGWNTFVQKGYECDDLMAALTTTVASRDNPVIIVANDGDLFQLLSPYCTYYSVRMDTIIDETEFRKKYGYPSCLVPMVKSICGCPSDNIKGVGGVGEISLKKFLSTKGDERIFNIIRTKWETVLKNQKLVHLPFEGTKVPKLKPFTMNMKYFIKWCTTNSARHLKRKGMYEQLFPSP